VLMCFFRFLPLELIDGEQANGCPLFSYHRWGPWNSSIKIDRNSPTPPLFFTGGKRPIFQYHSCSERRHFELKYFFRNLKKTFKDRWWAYLMVPIHWGGSPNSDPLAQSALIKGPKSANWLNCCNMATDCPIWLTFCVMTGHQLCNQK